jgi:hypothetical protein
MPAHAQYSAARLCAARATLDAATTRCVVQLQVPPNTVRILYALNSSTVSLPDTIGLLPQTISLLPDKLGWMGIAHIAEKVTGAKPGVPVSLYFYNNKRCVDRFAKPGGKQCKAMLQVDSCAGGSFDIPWQATLFPEKYYLCIVKPPATPNLHFSIEVVAITAD